MSIYGGKTSVFEGRALVKTLKKQFVYIFFQEEQEFHCVTEDKIKGRILGKE